MDRFTALTVFCAVVERNGFAAASRALGLSKAAVSKNVAELEAHLGVRLLQRTTRQVSLTDVGQVYYTHATEILDRLKRADDAAGEMTGAVRGRLRVSAPMSLGLTLLMPALPAFLERHPEVSVDLDLSDRVVDLVAEGFDIAIRGRAALPDSSLMVRKLGRLDRIVCAAPAYFTRMGKPAHPLDLDRHHCIIYSLGATPERWSFTREGKPIEVTVSGRLRVNNSLAIREALLQGAGLALIPVHYIREALATGQLQPVLDSWKAEDQWIYALYPSSLYATARVKAFLSFVNDHLGMP